MFPTHDKFKEKCRFSQESIKTNIYSLASLFQITQWKFFIIFTRRSCGSSDLDVLVSGQINENFRQSHRDIEKTNSLEVS